MGLATAVAIPVFRKQGFEKWVRLSFIAHSAVTPLISIVYFYPTFSYRLLVLGFPWAITAPLFMLLLAIMFRKKDKKEKGIEDNLGSVQTTARKTYMNSVTSDD